MDTVSAIGRQSIKGGLLPGWYAVAQADRIGSKPVRFTFNDGHYVLWRVGDGFSCAVDICPHRGAPLSHGRVVDGEITCPYHGWRFDGAGRCTHMPAVIGPCLKAHIETLPVRAFEGHVFVGWGGAPFILPSIMDGEHSLRHIQGRLHIPVADLAENMLDTTHTSVVHAGYLRDDRLPRIVTPRVVSGPDWIEAHYPSTATPTGWVSRLIGAGWIITDRFRAPGVAEVEYRRKGRLDFAVRFHLTPAIDGRVDVHAVMAVPGKGLWPWLKLAVVETVFQHLFNQDRVLLEAVNRNRAAFGRAPVYITPQDLLRRGIDAILRGEVPQTPRDVPDIRV